MFRAFLTRIIFFGDRSTVLIPEFKGSLRNYETFNTDSASHPPPPNPPFPSTDEAGQMAVTAAAVLNL